jgi:hypothetical protein
MSEMPVASGAAEFPVYLVEKSTGDVDRIDSHEAMQTFLMPSDVEGDVCEAYDWGGFVLRLAIAESRTEWLRIERTETKLIMPGLWELRFWAVQYHHDRATTPVLKTLAQFIKG